MEAGELPGAGRRGIGRLPFQAHADAGDAPRLRPQVDGDLRRAGSARPRRRRSLETQLDRLLDGLAGLQGIGMREPQGPHVGLVGRIRPVALVFHLEGVAQHRADHLQVRRDLVGQRADVHDRLHRIDDLGKAGLDDCAAHLGHLHRVPADPLHPVQDHEARPVREEVRLGGPGPFEAQGAVRTAGDARAIDEALLPVAAGCRVGDGEAIAGLLDREVPDLRVEGAPVPVAHHVGDRADRLASAVADVAQVAGVQLRRQWPRLQQPGLRRRLIGAEQHDRTGGGFGHDSSPWGCAVGAHSSHITDARASATAVDHGLRLEFYPPLPLWRQETPIRSALPPSTLRRHSATPPLSHFACVDSRPGVSRTVGVWARPRAGLPGWGGTPNRLAEPRCLPARLRQAPKLRCSLKACTRQPVVDIHSHRAS